MSSEQRMSLRDYLWKIIYIKKNFSVFHIYNTYIYLEYNK